MIGLKTAVAILVIMAAAAVNGNAQFGERIGNPQISVPISHPPGLGIAIKRVAFGPASGLDSDRVVNALTERLITRGIEVLEREKLQTLLREHNFSMSGHVDAASAAAMGRILGPTVMIFVDMQPARTEKKSLYDTVAGNRYYISQTNAHVAGSVRAVDLATGKIFAAKTLKAAPSLSNRSKAGVPEFPDETEVLDLAFAQVAGSAERLFMPWTETVKLFYYDDKDCGLKESFGRIKSGDTEEALRLSQAAVEACSGIDKPKILAHANHNVGMSYFILGDFDNAIRFLREADRIRSAKIHQEALSMVLTAQREDQAMKRVEERASVAEAAESGRAEAQAAATVTNEDVLAMARAGLPATVMMSKIKASPCKFDTSVDALIALKSAGVSDEVITGMLERK